MSETTKTIAEWQSETFGVARTDVRRLMETRHIVYRALDKLLDVDLSTPRPNLSRAIRAAEELAELIEWLIKDDNAEKGPWEVADIQIVLAGIVAAHGKEQQDLVDEKMAINRARRWNVTGDGHGQHVKDEP